VKPGVNLWSRALIYNRPTREGERQIQYALTFSHDQKTVF